VLTRFSIKEGKVKVTVISQQGKEAVVAILGADEFLGEGCLIGQPKRLTTASAMTECVTMRVEKSEVMRVLREEPAFSEMFMSHILTRNARVEEDLVDQLNRETACPRAVVDGQFRQGRPAGTDCRKDQSGNACRDDRHDPLTRQPFHEHVP